MSGSQPGVNPNKIPNPCGPCPRCGKTEVAHMPARDITQWVCETDPAHVSPTEPRDGQCAACARTQIASATEPRVTARPAVCFCLACNRSFPKPA
jgi:hypothetical protein